MTTRVSCPSCPRSRMDWTDDGWECESCGYTVAPPKAVLTSKAGIEAARAALAKAVAEHPSNEEKP